MSEGGGGSVAVQVELGAGGLRVQLAQSGFLSLLLPAELARVCALLPRVPLLRTGGCARATGAALHPFSSENREIRCNH